MINKNLLTISFFKHALNNAILFALLLNAFSFLYHFIVYGADLLIHSSKITMVDILMLYLVTLISLVFPLMLSFFIMLVIDLKIISFFCQYKGKILFYQLLFFMLGIISFIPHNILNSLAVEHIKTTNTDNIAIYILTWLATCIATASFYKSWIKEQ